MDIGSEPNDFSNLFNDNEDSDYQFYDEEDDYNNIEDNDSDEEYRLSDNDCNSDDSYYEQLTSESEYDSDNKNNKRKPKELKSNELRKPAKLIRTKIVPKPFEDECYDEINNKANETKKKRVFRKITDDGDEKNYIKRIKKYQTERLIEKQQNIVAHGNQKDDDDIEISHLGGNQSLQEYIKLDGGFQIPEKIWNKLYPYQQDGVKWLWELHQLGCGGIVGDEMGLGKTIQVIAFLSGLSCSTLYNFRELYQSLGPVILVCPATVMHQWVSEFHSWWPKFRVAILHNTGSFLGKKSNLIQIINKCNGILITSYSSTIIYQDELLKYDWHYVILDEGHKIRNPDAQVTFACKMFRTVHRIILSGTPIQNNLKELWSLFDFIYPGKLGTLPVFMEHFAVPITQGGYANATKVQVQIAYKCATLLRDSIKPYLLIRKKNDVKNCIELPNKNEQVLFCKLTDLQRKLYEQYLESTSVRDILKGSTQIFVGLMNMRKICNHPDIYLRGIDNDGNKIQDFGYYKKSGKMMVVESLLKIWLKQSHKVLLFTQSRKMLKVFKKFLSDKNYTYLEMDGSTPVGTRQAIVKQFNEDPNIFIFLLTTRVGGIGINLIGANRVIIYDPDWNPSTDVQARERCWRIGQNRQVTIYRLLCSGTVEEKIYHRQIFKQYLTNRVLKDPKQKRFFKTNDLYELFTLGSESETNYLLTDSDLKVKLNSTKTKKSEKSDQFELPPEKINELRIKAKALSKMLAEKFSKKNENSSTNTNETEVASCSKDTTDNNEKETSNSEQNKKTKKSKGLKFEGKRIKYLVKQDDYKEIVANRSAEQDDYVLKKLFKKSKVQSALQHDKLETPTDPEYSIIENEADTVAKQAIEALKRSREMCYGATSGIPTWTGSNTSHMKNKIKFQKKRLGNNQANPSSNSLLDQIKKRNRLAPVNNEIATNSLDTKLPHDTNELLSDIRSYLNFQCQGGCEATTQELLDKFRDKVPPHQSALFKALLWQICDFSRRADKVGVWKLKAEFR